jgi:hypothetical protein
MANGSIDGGLCQQRPALDTDALAIDVHTSV